MKASVIIRLTGVALFATIATGQSFGQVTNQMGSADGLEVQAQQTINTFKEKDPSLDTFFQNAAGYAVFPSVGEGALIVGAARGSGLVYQNGKPVGKATVTKGTFGAQVGGQSYAELIFFQTPQALQEFKSGNYELSAGVSAVAAAANAAKAANYSHGVAVFTTGREGVMAQAAIGGQKFSYQALPGANESMQGGGTSPGGSSSGQGETTPK